MKQEFILHPGRKDITSRCVTFIKGLSQQKRWRISISQYRKKRSNEQNALLHKQLSILAEHLGYSLKEMKIVAKDYLLGPCKVIELNGETFKFYPETSQMTTTELAGFMNELIAWAATEFGVILPLPDDPYHESQLEGEM